MQISRFRSGSNHGQLLVAVTAVLTFAAPLIAADWPRWRGPKLDGISSETGWATQWPAGGAKVAWRADVGVGFASVAVADGRLYTLGHNGDKGDGGRETVWCLDAATGEPVWKHTYNARLLPNLHEGGPASTPTIEAGRVYTYGKDGDLFCFEAQTGRVIWHKQVRDMLGMKTPEWGFASSPLILDEKLIVEAGHTLALDKSDGRLIWKSQSFKPAYASAVPMRHNGRTLVVSLNTQGLAVLDAADGSTVAFTKWETRFDTNATTPIIAGDRIFMSTGYDRGCALFRFTGSSLVTLYENKSMSNHMAACVLIDGHLYGFNGNSHQSRNVQLVCMDLESGQVKWAERGLGCGSLMAADGKLIVLGSEGELVVAPATPDGFTPTARMHAFDGRALCWTQPVLANGRIYCRAADGRLACVDVSGK